MKITPIAYLSIVSFVYLCAGIYLLHQKETYGVIFVIQLAYLFFLALPLIFNKFGMFIGMKDRTIP